MVAEPTTALDVTVQVEMLQLIRSLQRQTGVAVLFITHDMGVVTEIANRVLIAEEPVSALEVAVQEQVLTVLERLTREEGTGLLFISHDMAVVERIAAQKLRAAEVLWGFSGIRPADPVFGRNHVLPAFRQLYEGRRVGNGSSRATSRRKAGVSPPSSGWSSSSAKRRPA